MAAPKNDPTDGVVVEADVSPQTTLNSMIPSLIAAQQQFGKLIKKNTAKVPTKNGGNYSYTYADLGSVLDLIMPVLHDNGLTITQSTDILEGQAVLITTLHHISGETLSGRYPLVTADRNDPQKLGSSVTYARRYAIIALLGIAAEDDDGQAARTPAPDIREELASALRNAGLNTKDKVAEAVKERFGPSVAGVKDLSKNQIQQWIEDLRIGGDSVPF